MVKFQKMILALNCVRRIHVRLRTKDRPPGHRRSLPNTGGYTLTAFQFQEGRYKPLAFSRLAILVEGGFFGACCRKKVSERATVSARYTNAIEDGRMRRNAGIQ
jgi:hypothetical protein